MEHLRALENKSIYIIREAFCHFKKPALLWSIGKDSTTLLWLIRKAFFGKVPFAVVHIDTTFKFEEMYQFRDSWAKAWDLELIVERNKQALAKNVSYLTHDAFTCCHELKTVALQQAIGVHEFDALFVGIRRDEHGIRAKERHFSSRSSDFAWDYNNQAAEVWDHYKKETDGGRHVRVHPLLEWTELDIWCYIKEQDIPVNELYFSREGKRYRSLGCMPITNPIESDASTIDEIIEELSGTKTAERAGRAQDKEAAFIMQKLRSLGYM